MTLIQALATNLGISTGSTAAQVLTALEARLVANSEFVREGSGAETALVEADGSGGVRLRSASNP